MESQVNNNVFINCPFDEKHINDILKPIMFCLISNGLSPQLSLMIQDSGQKRIDKIVDLMKNSKYNIHDLSLLKTKSTKEYARMNMPYELGIDYGLRISGVERYGQKQFLILGSSRYDYMKAISDISGFDIHNHGGKTEKVFDCMYSWLSSLGLQKNMPPALTMYYDFLDFNVWLYMNILNEYGCDVAKEHQTKISITDYEIKIQEYLKQKSR